VYADDLVGDDEMLGHTSHSLKMPLDKLYAGLADNLHTEQVLPFPNPPAVTLPSIDT
jgi:hypothetical protein